MFSLIHMNILLNKSKWILGRGVCSGWGVQWMAGTGGATSRTLTQTTAKRKELQQRETRIHHLTLGRALLCMKCLALYPFLSDCPESLQNSFPNRTYRRSIMNSFPNRTT